MIGPAGATVRKELCQTALFCDYRQTIKQMHHPKCGQYTISNKKMPTFYFRQVNNSVAGNRRRV
jgi:hypothetical protein